MKKYFFCFATFLFAFTSVEVVAQDAQLPPLDSFSVGETWEWKEKLVADAEPQKPRMESLHIRTVILDAGEKKFEEKFPGGSSINAIEQVNSKAVEKPFRKWPLKVGAKWEYEENWTSSDGTTGYTKQDVEIVAFEKIEVPSGTYSAFKIVYRGMYKNARGSGEMNDTFWYAPKMKADVKHINESGGQTFSSVLVKYSDGLK